MARFLLVMATAFGFLLTIGFANLLVPILHTVHGVTSKRNVKKKGRFYGVSWRASKKGIPTMGGLCFAFATLLSVTFARLGLALGQPELMDSQWMGQVDLAIFAAFAFGAIGLLDDLTRVQRNQPAGLPEFLKFMLQAVVVAVVLVAYAQQGYFSSATMMPVVGFFDFGSAFYAISFLFALFFVRCVEKTDGVDGLCTACSFIVLLALVVISVVFGSFEAAIVPAALAGSLLAFMFWNFHPAKITMGSTGSLFLAGAMLGIAQGLNWPGLLWLLGLPYFAEGLFSLLQFLYYLFTGKRIFSSAPLHVLLAKKGWSQFGLIYLFSGIAILGVTFTVLWIRLG